MLSVSQGKGRARIAGFALPVFIANETDSAHSELVSSRVETFELEVPSGIGQCGVGPSAVYQTLYCYFRFSQWLAVHELHDRSSDATFICPFSRAGFLRGRLCRGCRSKKNSSNKERKKVVHSDCMDPL